MQRGELWCVATILSHNFFFHLYVFVQIWDLGRRQSRHVRASRFPVVRMTFSRLAGDHTLAVLHPRSEVFFVSFYTYLLAFFIHHNFNYLNSINDPFMHFESVVSTGVPHRIFLFRELSLWDTEALTRQHQITLDTSRSALDMDLCGVSPVLLTNDNVLRYAPTVVRNSPMLEKGQHSLISFFSQMSLCMASSCFQIPIFILDIPLLLNTRKVAQLKKDFESSSSENPALWKIAQRKVDLLYSLPPLIIFYLLCFRFLSRHPVEIQLIFQDSRTICF